MAWVLHGVRLHGRRTTPLISFDGWDRYAVWEHSQSVKDLYERRCLMEAEEMTCAAQAAELLVPLVADGDTLLDVGCGSGYFFHSLRTRGIPVQYFGVDASKSLIAIGRATLPRFGLEPDRLQVGRLEDLDGRTDHVVCMNVLSNLDNYHRPLDRMLRMANKTVLLRESLKEGAEYSFVPDRFLDEGTSLNVHVNSYDVRDVCLFVEERGFDVTLVTDRRTGGKPEDVIGYPHYWTFLMAQKRD